MADRPAFEVQLRNNPETVIWDAMAAANPVRPEIVEVCALFCEGIDSVGVERGRLEDLLRLAFFVDHLQDVTT